MGVSICQNRTIPEKNLLGLFFGPEKSYPQGKGVTVAQKAKIQFKRMYLAS